MPSVTRIGEGDWIFEDFHLQSEGGSNPYPERIATSQLGSGSVTFGPNGAVITVGVFSDSDDDFAYVNLPGNPLFDNADQLLFQYWYMLDTEPPTGNDFSVGSVDTADAKNGIHYDATNENYNVNGSSQAAGNVPSGVVNRLQIRAYPARNVVDFHHTSGENGFEEEIRVEASVPAMPGNIGGHSNGQQETTMYLLKVRRGVKYGRNIG